MAVYYNGTAIENITFNGVQLDKVYYNGTLVWENWKKQTGVLINSDWSSPSFLGGTHSVTIPNNVRNISVSFGSYGYQQDGGGAIKVTYSINFDDGTSQEGILENSTGANWSISNWVIKTNNNKLVKSIDVIFSGKIKVQNSNIKIFEWEQKGSTSKATPMMVATSQTLEEPTQEKHEEENKEGKNVIKL